MPSVSPSPAAMVPLAQPAATTNTASSNASDNGASFSDVLNSLPGCTTPDQSASTGTSKAAAQAPAGAPQTASKDAPGTQKGLTISAAPLTLADVVPFTPELCPNSDTAVAQQNGSQQQTSASDTSDSETEQPSGSSDSGDANSDPAKLPVMVALPMTLLIPPIQPVNFTPAPSHTDNAGQVVISDPTSNPTAPTVPVVAAPVANAPQAADSSVAAKANADGAVEHLDGMREILDAMTPMQPTDASASEVATPTASDKSDVTVRISARPAAPIPAAITKASQPGASDVKPNVQSTTTPAPTNTTTMNAAPAAVQIQTAANPLTAKYAQQDSAHAQSTIAANSKENTAQVSPLPVDPHTVAAPNATAAAAENNAGHADANSDHERQQFQEPQLAAPAQTETFAANAFSAVAPGGYWTEKTGDAAPVKTAPVFQQVLDALPKPLQATTITLRPEGFGAIHIRVVPQPDNSQAPWRITIRTSDSSAHALLSQNVAELRQNLRSEPVNPFSTVRSAQQQSSPESPAARQDGSDPRGGRRQEFEQRQRNRSRGFIFELPELDA